MWLQFFAQNAHFAIYLFAALVCSGIAWLYIDAWSNRHKLKELCKWVGFASLGLSFLAQATVIEQSVLGRSLLGHVTSGLIIIFRLVGYAGIITGNLIDPLQAVPQNKGLVFDEPEEKKDDSPATKQPADSATDQPTAKASLGIASFISLSSKWLLPAGGLTVAVLYWRRATTGLERHLKPIARGFLLL